MLFFIQPKLLIIAYEQSMLIQINKAGGAYGSNGTGRL